MGGDLFLHTNLVKTVRKLTASNHVLGLVPDMDASRDIYPEQLVSIPIYRIYFRNATLNHEHRISSPASKGNNQCSF